MEWRPSHCDCVLTLDDDGEPSGFVSRCDRHPQAHHSQLAAESRAITAAKHAVAQHHGMDVHEVDLTFDGQAKASARGVSTKPVAPLSLPDYVATMGNLPALIDG